MLVRLKSQAATAPYNCLAVQASHRPVWIFSEPCRVFTQTDWVSCEADSVEDRNDRPNRLETTQTDTRGAAALAVNRAFAETLSGRISIWLGKNIRYSILRLDQVNQWALTARILVSEGNSDREGVRWGLSDGLGVNVDVEGQYRPAVGGDHTVGLAIRNVLLNFTGLISPQASYRSKFVHFGHVEFVCKRPDTGLGNPL